MTRKQFINELRDKVYAITPLNTMHSISPFEDVSFFHCKSGNELLDLFCGKLFKSDRDRLIQSVNSVGDFFIALAIAEKFNKCKDVVDKVMIDDVIDRISTKEIDEEEEFYVLEDDDDVYALEDDDSLEFELA